MIQINTKKYHNYSTKVTWEKFEVIHDGQKLKGLAPFISFNIEDAIFIGLELILSQEIIESMKLNNQTNIKSYLTDILYEDSRGWISLITDEYDCTIVRLDERKFKIHFIVTSAIENIDIMIDTQAEF